MSESPHDTDVIGIGSGVCEEKPECGRQFHARADSKVKSAWPNSEEVTHFYQTVC